MIDNVIFCRHLTTRRPLLPRPDIASSQTCPFDSVNSPRHILLAPIEKPNIPSSIDTLDEQKTNKKPKDKKKKKKKKKDEEQDNPSDVQDNNVLT
jgi:CelD/BcsL family acetyltransferase involved in cellulose biosynthesis